MSTKPKTLDVTIMGRNYKVACADEEREGLLAAVTHLDDKMNEIKAIGKVASAERIAVMAALNTEYSCPLIHCPLRCLPGPGDS